MVNVFLTVTTPRHQMSSCNRPRVKMVLRDHEHSVKFQMGFLAILNFFSWLSVRAGQHPPFWVKAWDADSISSWIQFAEFFLSHCPFGERRFKAHTFPYPGTQKLPVAKTMKGTGCHGPTIHPTLWKLQMYLTGDTGHLDFLTLWLREGVRVRPGKSIYSTIV